MDTISYLLGKKSSGGGSGGLDWTKIGYEGTPQIIIDNFNYSKEIYDNWDATQTNLTDKFRKNKNIEYLPLVDTSSATIMDNMCYECSNLQIVPLLDTKNVTSMNNIFNSCNKLRFVPVLNTAELTSMRYAFSSCPRLTDESLDNILQMCINAEKYTGAKTLNAIGISTSNYPSSKIETLAHYQDFLDAGWTIS